MGRSQMDVINMISKVPGLPDGNIVNPADKYQPAYEHYINGLAIWLHSCTHILTLFNGMQT